MMRERDAMLRAGAAAICHAALRLFITRMSPLRAIAADLRATRRFDDSFRRRRRLMLSALSYATPFHFFHQLIFDAVFIFASYYY
jgi:hypothetical protein